MELIREEENKKIFVDDNKIYSMINMGSYVGNKQREWYAPIPEVWILMFCDEKRNDGKELHMEALIDDSGNYIRFLISLGNEKRAIQLHNGKVFCDTISRFENSFDDVFALGDNYIAIDEDFFSPKSILLENYLTSKPTFHLENKIYEGELSDNNLIANFLNKNNELKAYLEHLETSKKR